MSQPDLARLKALLFGEESRRLGELEARLAALESGRAPPTVAPAPRPFVAARAIAFVGLLVILALLLRTPYEHYRKSAEIEAALTAAKADARLQPYPLSVSEDWKAGAARLTGLAPSRAALDKLVTALTAAAAPLTLTTEVETLAPAGAAPDLAQAVKDLASRLAALEKAPPAARDERPASLSATVTDLSQRLAALEKAAPAAKPTEGAALADLAAALSRQETRLEAIAERLAGLETPGADVAGRIAAAKSALDAEIAELRADQTRLREALTGADAVAKDQDARIRRLEAGLAALSAERSAPARAFTPRPAPGPFAEATAATRALGARIGEARAKAAALSAAIACIRTPADLPGVQSRATALVGALDAAVAGAGRAQAALAAKSAEFEARELAARITAETRIAFAGGDALADPAAATAALDRLAAALVRARLGVRVVGLAAPTDPAGLARARAAKITDMLAKRGVPSAAAVPADRAAAPGEAAGVVFEPLAP